MKQKEHKVKGDSKGNALENDHSLKALAAKADEILQKSTQPKGYWVRCCGLPRWVEDEDGFPYHEFDHDEEKEFTAHLRRRGK
jgi:hypothetical protein